MKIAICDDEEQQQNIIKQYILNHKDTYPSICISVFSSGEELLTSVKQGSTFDFLFLDIQMKKINGLQTAQEIRKTNKYAIILFITSFSFIQYFNAAFALNTFQYLVKPVKQDMFDREFQRAVNQYQLERKKYIVRSKPNIIALEVKDIVYLEIFKRNMLIYTKTKSYEKTGKIAEEEKKLTPYGFVRTHHSYLVNMAYISEIAEKDVVMTNGVKVMLSTRKRKDVLEKFIQFTARYSL
jgi:DNA-binding LytR/AlgR family response regulator